MRLPAVGAVAPLFTLADDSGTSVSLQTLRGQRVVLFFYPRDSTAGCTAQVCGLRSKWAALQRTGVVVLGVSPDSEASHQKFRRRHRLPFPLLVDTGHQVAEAYGVWAEKQLFGYHYFGNLRTTFLIDRKGRIERIFERVKPMGHASQVLEALTA